MCYNFELELCCKTTPTNFAPHTIKIYRAVAYCNGFIEVIRQWKDHNSGVASAYGHPSPPPSPPAPQPPPKYYHCPHFDSRAGPHHLERIFLSTCAECIDTTYYETHHEVSRNRVYRNEHQWETELHALQLNERLLWARFESAFFTTEWAVLVQQLAEEFGVKERWVLSYGGTWGGVGVGTGMMWVRIPTTVEEDEVRLDDAQESMWVTAANADLNWQRWWRGEFGEDMWEACTCAADVVFPDGIWGPFGIEGYDGNEVALNFQVLTPVSRRSPVSPASSTISVSDIE